MRKTSILFVALLCNSFVVAQSKIEGRLINSKAEPLPFVSLMLLNATDSSFAKGGISDDAGKFVIDNVKNGNYLLMASFVGYKKSTLSKVEVQSKQNISLGSLTLEEETTQLNEVVVKADKPLFEQHLDRLVMNVESRISFSGNTVLEILQKSPGIIVDQQNNTINMNGKSGVRIMINEKIVQLPLTVVVQMLSGMSSAKT
ncbi:MAG: carboxypeptidase-like regulatory domain-containing protein [Cyclobacteriaceae bacterium]